MDQKKRTKELIKYLVSNMSVSTITSLTKMLYLIDLASVSSGKEKTTDFNYVRYYYGPYDKRIEETLNDLIIYGELIVNVRTSSNGEPYMIYKLPEGVTEYEYDDINSDIVDNLTQNLGHLSAKTLTDIAYKTKPMTSLGATLGGTQHLNDVLNLESI